MAAEEYYRPSKYVPYNRDALDLIRQNQMTSLSQLDRQMELENRRSDALRGDIGDIGKNISSGIEKGQARKAEREKQDYTRKMDERKLATEEATAKDQAAYRQKQAAQIDLETAAKRADMDFQNQEVSPGITRRQREADLKDQEAALNRKKIEAEIGQINAKAKEAQQGKPAEAPKEWQFTAAGFGNNMENAEAELSALEAQGFDRADPWSALQATTPDSFGAYGKSPAVQQYERAQRAFINNLLRDESGASISKEDYAAKEAELFPVAGDSPETKAAKKRARMLAVAARKAEAGSAYDMIKAQMAAGGVKGAPGVGGAPARTPVKRQRNPSTGEIRIVYNDGSTEVVK